MSSVQLVTGEGEIDKDRIDEFLTDKNMTSAGVNYQVVAIMGPQSSGKSTLLNNLFGTGFQEMDAMSGRGQTTKGIWLANSPKLSEPLTMVMDLEGTDGRERGEDDTSFERQSALFALSVSDILLINIWCHDIGREQGSGKPLMKTVLQVNLKLFTPSPGAKKTVLLFVIRDRSKTPLPMLKAVLREDLGKMWASITKPAEFEDSQLEDFFEVAYTSLPNYEEKEDEFKAECVLLRKRFTQGEEDSLTHIRENGKLPGNAVSFNMCSIWSLIKDHKDLNLPAHKVMVANIRCTELCNDQFQALADDAVWQALQEETGQNLVEEFGQRLSGLIDSVVTGYDVEARYFDEQISSEKREDLIAKIHALIQGTYDAQLSYMKSYVMDEFGSGLDKGMSAGKTFMQSSLESQTQALAAFDEKQSWLQVSTTDWTLDQLATDIETSIKEEIHQRRVKRVSELLEEAGQQLDNKLCLPASELMENLPADLWDQLGRLLKDTTAQCFKHIQDQLQGYDLTKEELEDAQNSLNGIASSKLESQVREASHTVLSRMQYKFSYLFSLDEQGLPRTWGVRDDIPKAAKSARLAAGQVLIQLCIFRVDDAKVFETKRVDSGIKAFEQRDLDDSSSKTSLSSSQSDLFTLTDWPDIQPQHVLLTPTKVRQVWKQFIGDSRTTIQQAVLTQQANRMASNRMPPIWALLLLVFLGMDEALAVMYSPFYLVIVLVVGAFLYTVWRELDVENEMQKGFLPGSITIARRFYPTMKKVSLRTYESSLGQIQSFINNSTNDNQSARSQDSATGSPLINSQGQNETGIWSQGKLEESIDSSNHYTTKKDM